MSKDQSIVRKINPIRLLDAGADLLSSAVKSTAKLPGRLTSFIGNKLDDAPAGPADGGGKQKLENLRVSVMVDGPVPAASEVDALHYTVSLIDKKSGESLHAVHRTFAACQQVVLVVRSMAPKLEIPVQPQPLTARSSIPLLVEERRKFFQAYANVAIGNVTSGNLREVRELIGYGEYLAAKEDSTIDAARPNLKHVVNDSFGSSVVLQNNSSLAGRPKDSSESGAVPTVTQLRSRRRPADATPQDSAASPTISATSTLQAGFPAQGTGAIEECFRVIDDGGAGYITLDDMPAFVAALPSGKAQRVFSASVKKTDAFNQQGFVQMVEKVAQESGTSVMEWIHRFRASKYQPLYTAIGDLEGCADKFSSDDVKALMYILRVGGVRLVTQQEVDEETPFLSLPVSFDDFCDLMNLLLIVVPFDQLWRDLQPGPHHGTARVIHLLNKACGSANKNAVQALRSKIQELGGGTRRANVPAGKCSNCEAVEARLRGMKVALQELQLENEKLRGEPTEDIARLQQKISAATSRESELLSQVSALKSKVAELEKALATTDQSSTTSSSSESEGGDDVAEPLESRCNLFLLNPLHLGSSAEVPVVDLPGPIVFQLPEDFRPLGFVVDAFLCQPDGGTEYLAIRDASGQRCCAWTIEGDVLGFPWTLQEFKLPHKKWVRLQIRFHWTEHAFDFVVDGSTVFAKLAMRDDDAGGASTLDIFPRDDVLLCYANMNFFR